MAALELIGPRPAESGAYLDAAGYVAGLLADAGYDVLYQEFTYDLWGELLLPVLEQVSPVPTSYLAYPAELSTPGFATMEYSAAGDVTAPVALAANFGCDASDFAVADFAGKVALIERGVLLRR